MNTGNIFVGICVVAVFIPFGLKALSNNHINLNGLALDFAETVTEIITRHEVNFHGQQNPPKNDQGGL